METEENHIQQAVGNKINMKYNVDYAQVKELAPGQNTAEMRIN